VDAHRVSGRPGPGAARPRCSRNVPQAGRGGLGGPSDRGPM